MFKLDVEMLIKVLFFFYKNPLVEPKKLTIASFYRQIHHPDTQKYRIVMAYASSNFHKNQHGDPQDLMVAILWS